MQIELKKNEIVPFYRSKIYFNKVNSIDVINSEKNHFRLTQNSRMIENTFSQNWINWTDLAQKQSNDTTLLRLKLSDQNYVTNSMQCLPSAQIRHEKFLND